jgi:phosphopantothenoylcysteine decarboxylase/phosphopantothenate--cysteine ligase
MHTEMWEHPAVQDNLAILEARGVHLVPPDEGRLAGGDMGSGRLAAPEAIYETVESILSDGDLQGRTVVVTAGGTREAIDPVRYVGNRSTGKQGYAVAEAAKARGANVTLISTVATAAPVGVEIVRVESATQMHAAVLERSDADVIVMAAAVADFRPVGVSASKIKKDAGPPKLELEATPDILAELGAKKKPGQVIVGFAAETEELVSHAQSKLERKNVDVIVANDVSAPQVGFAHDTNEVTIFVADGCQRHISLRSKQQIAEEVLNTVAQILIG